MKHTPILLIALAVLLAACIPASAPAQSLPTDTPAAAPAESASPTPAPTPVQSQPTDIPTPAAPATPPPFVHDPQPGHTHYTLRARLDYAARTLAVAQTVTYVNTTEQPLNELLFVVEANHEADVFHLNEINVDENIPLASWALNGSFLRVPLPDSLPAGGTVTLQLDYTLHAPHTPSPFGYSRRQLNLSNWYPCIPPYDAALGWLAYLPGSVGEHNSYSLANYQVELELLNPDPALTVAASAPAQRFGNLYRYQINTARNFTFSLSPHYEVISQTVTTALGEVVVLGYHFPETPDAGQAALQTTAASLVWYSELFGPYPHASLSVVEAEFPDGMEFDGLYLLSQDWYLPYQGDAKNYLTMLAAHETAHQWWYGLLGNNQAMEPWLDEALSAYSELLYYERAHPDLVDWWWSYRVNRFRPDGPINHSIYMYGDFRLYIDATYLRGALFLDELRVLMGEDAFLAALRDYAHQNRNQLVTADDFFAAIRSHTTADLTPLFAKYFWGGG